MVKQVNVYLYGCVLVLKFYLVKIGAALLAKHPFKLLVFVLLGNFIWEKLQQLQRIFVLLFNVVLRQYWAYRKLPYPKMRRRRVFWR
jgi:hypothetical protein